MSDKNQQTYKSSNIVRYYTQLSMLQPAEKTIINLLKDQLSSMKMLDIGVGGGRTTKHFLPLVKEYFAIDYSEEMISSCQQRFNHFSDSISLQVGDARNLSQFLDHSFDFILFSFNGIDFVSHSDRLKIFQEIKRIGKDNCYFLFSSHNLQAISHQFNFKKQISLNPFTTYINLAMLAIFKLFNPSIDYEKINHANYFILRDESHNFSLNTYYIRPQEQVKQLESNGFKNIEIYSWKTGHKILNFNDPCLNSDLWIYYFCNI